MTYSTREVAGALGIPLKRLDNILSTAARSAGTKGRHGLSRAVPVHVIDQLALALLLTRDLGVPTNRALDISTGLLQSHDGALPVGVLGSLRYDVERLRAVVRQALADTLEGIGRPRRGRPPGRKLRPRDASP